MLVMLPEMEISLKKIKHYTLKLNLALVVVINRLIDGI